MPDAAPHMTPEPVTAGAAPAQTLPPVSIVVNTLDRAPRLRKLLASLRHLDYPAFEVVVVNGPSTDETDAVLAEFADDIKVVRCPDRNLSRSRNLGIAAAAGELIAFIDDDALPATPGWLTAIVSPLVGQPAAGGVGGPVLRGDSAELEFDAGATTDYGMQILTRSDVSALATDPDGRRWTRRVAGCNCVFRRNVLLEIGGFDETFTYYLDETDVCLRTTRRGHAILDAPTAPVRHYSAASALRRSFHDLDWAVIARSDTYYALKNGADRPARRLVETLRLAPRKHFFRDIQRHYRERHHGTARWLLYLMRWARGLAAGVWLGLARARRTPLGPQLPPPPPFRVFPPARPASPLRVGLLSRAYPPTRYASGIAAYTHELAHGLHALGHEVHVFTEGPGRMRHDGVRLFVHGVRAQSLPVTPALPETDRQLRWALAVASRVAEFAHRGVTLDIVESPNWESEGIALRRAADIPMVVRLHSPLTAVARYEPHAGHAADLRASMLLERWLVANANGVTSSTDAVLVTVRDTMGIDPADGRLHRRIPLGVVAPGPSAESPSGRRLLFVGRLERRKGIHTLLAIAPRLLRRYPDLHIDVVGNETATAPGSPSPRERFERETGMTLRRRCRFRGFVGEEALQAFYRRCTVLVAPSLYESFGLIYLEAMRHGKPVVGCRAGGIPEVVRDGETGLLVPPDDPDALHDATVRLLDDPALARRLGTRAREVMVTEFSSRRMAERTIEFYREVLERAVHQARRDDPPGA
jgi:glycogen synthase